MYQLGTEYISVVPLRGVKNHLHLYRRLLRPITPERLLGGPEARAEILLQLVQGIIRFLPHDVWKNRVRFIPSLFREGFYDVTCFGVSFRDVVKPPVLSHENYPQRRADAILHILYVLLFLRRRYLPLRSRLWIGWITHPLGFLRRFPKSVHMAEAQYSNARQDLILLLSLLTSAGKKIAILAPAPYLAEDAWSVIQALGLKHVIVTQEITAIPQDRAFVLLGHRSATWWRMNREHALCFEV